MINIKTLRVRVYRFLLYYSFIISFKIVIDPRITTKYIKSDTKKPNISFS